MTGLAAVQARVAELQALLAPSSGTSSGSASGAATDATFEAALAQAGLDVTGATAPVGSGVTSDQTSGIAPGSGVTAQDLVAAAERYIGTPYVWGGESLDEGGLDCSGLVLRSLTDLGVADGVPRVARDQQRLGEHVASLDEALPGDLLVFDGGTHIAIYVGDGQMIDAPKPGGHVSIRDVYEEPTNIRRILPQETAIASATAPASTVASLPTGSASTLAAQAQWQILTSILGGAA